MVNLTRKNWVIGNWKLNPYFQDAQKLFQDINNQYIAQPELQQCQVAIASPSIYLSFFVAQNYRIPSVAQDVSIISGTGAYTGEISADLLKHSHIDYVLIGHSERRELFGDDIKKIQKKIQNSLQAGLTIIYCVGESLAEREAGHANQIVLQQLDDLKTVLSTEDWSKILIAYEPIWAIGTGKTASPEDAQQM
ncbi:hypothetical protein GWI33_010045, partial [Rhynchophorus ferrugineus]